MAQFRPSVFVKTEGKFVWDSKKGRNIYVDYFFKEYPTYRELKKDLPNLYPQSVDGILGVTRSRRGEWGEWYEKWVGGKIVFEGWM